MIDGITQMELTLMLISRLKTLQKNKKNKNLDIDINAKNFR